MLQDYARVVGNYIDQVISYLLKMHQEHRNPSDGVNRETDSGNLAEIVPGLWIGALAGLRQVLKNSSFSTANKNWTIITILDSEKLLSLTKLLLAQHPSTDGKISNRNSRIVAHEVWKLKDRPNSDFISQRLSQILQVMDDALPTLTLKPTSTIPQQSITANDDNKACLVHCAKGISRSAAVCAAWYISRRHTSIQETMAVIRMVRPQAQPNLGFLAGLRAIEQSHGNIDAAIARLGTVETKTKIEQDSDNLDRRNCI